MDDAYVKLVPLGYQKALAIIPKVTGLLSMMGSSWIIYEVLSDKKKRGSMYHRILLCLSLSDLNCSFWVYFLSSWMLPTQERWSPSSNSNVDNTFYMSVGTWGTCDLQGFMFQLGIATPLYNGVLSLYYLLLLRYNWSPKQMAQRIERCLHPSIWLFALGTALAALFLDLYNPSLASWCTITEFPYNCNHPTKTTLFNLYNVSDISVNGSSAISNLALRKGSCLRGRSEVFASIFQWLFLFGPTWLMVAFTTVNMILVYRTVRQQERKMETKYKFNGLALDRERQQQKQRETKQRQQHQHNMTNPKARTRQRESERIFKISILYTSGFYCTFGFYTILNVIGMFHGINEDDLFWLLPLIVINNILLPLQGLFNFLIYLYPRYQRYKEQRRRQVALAQQNKQQQATAQSRLQQDEATPEDQESNDKCSDNRTNNDHSRGAVPHSMSKQRRHSSRRKNIRAECNLALHCVKDTLERGWRGSINKNSHRSSATVDDTGDEIEIINDDDYKLGCEFTDVSDDDSRPRINGTSRDDLFCPIDSTSLADECRFQEAPGDNVNDAVAQNEG